ncbi:hypothetical protein PsYK624_101760 [Phanerochaete sordida]|uniref:Uncharacterized protein n=1 Tax=Phanerochaete sordida TaxID=48140 RepID=A0A9P3GDB9_9APHY|nr:hypothetical protein PsYK624_101760 [Phanerochaete sordida]
MSKQGSLRYTVPDLLGPCPRQTHREKADGWNVPRAGLGYETGRWLFRDAPEQPPDKATEMDAADDDPARSMSFAVQAEEGH